MSELVWAFPRFTNAVIVTRKIRVCTGSADKLYADSVCSEGILREKSVVTAGTTTHFKVSKKGHAESMKSYKIR